MGKYKENCLKKGWGERKWVIFGPGLLGAGPSSESHGETRAESKVEILGERERERRKNGALTSSGGGSTLKLRKREK